MKWPWEGGHTATRDFSITEAQTSLSQHLWSATMGLVEGDPLTLLGLAPQASRRSQAQEVFQTVT